MPDTPISRRSIAVVAGLLVLLLAAGGAVFTGVGPAPGGSDSGERLTDYPTGTPLDDSAGSGDGTSDSVAPFSFTIESIEECGQTCRDVTASLRNNQDQPATAVTVFTRIYAGEDNTAAEDRVWEGKEEVGDLAAGATHTTTRRVELSFQDGLKIQNRGGWVTIVTTVKTSQRTVTFKGSEQVS